MNDPGPDGSPSEASLPHDEPFVVARVVAPPPGGSKLHTSAAASATPPSTDNSSDEPLGSFGRHKIPILITIFVAAGILGLPLLLLSPVFSKTEKVIWTIIILLYTVLVFWILGYCIMLIARDLRTLF
jgi:hypothetical protein